MSVKEMYFTSSRNKVVLKCYFFYVELFPLISQFFVVQTVTASACDWVATFKISLNLGRWTCWGLSDRIHSSFGNLRDLWKAVLIWKANYYGVFWRVMTALADPSRDLCPAVSCISLQGQGIVDARSSSVRECLEQCTSVSFAYYSGGEAN